MFIIPDWDVFQTYKDRRPPWIRLHRTLLDNQAFQSLPLSARAMLPMLWLLAPETEDYMSGRIELSANGIAYRLRLTEAEVEKNLLILVSAGFIIDVRNCTESYKSVPRDRGRDKEETEANFASFWSAYPRKIGKLKAKASYIKALSLTTHETIMAGLLPFVESIKGTDEKYIPHPATWLNGGRWDDEGVKKKRSMTPGMEFVP